jgi:Family of unknown function (DUF6111)
MTRAIFGEALLFFLPFALFALLLIAKRKSPFRLDAWSASTVWLIIAGLGCAILGFLFTGLTAERQRGAFSPPHIENGRVVPGQFR